MRFEHHDDGTLEVFAENHDELQELFMHPHGVFCRSLGAPICNPGGDTPREQSRNMVEYAINLKHCLDTLDEGKPVHFHHKPPKRKWYMLTGSTGKEYVEPYARLLKWRTAYADVMPDLDMTPHLKKRAMHTHIIERLTLECHDFTWVVYMQSEDFNGEGAEKRANKYANHYVQEDVGVTHTPQEFIQMGNGGYKRNPDYATGKLVKATPSASQAGVWRALADWWITNHANEAQRIILASNKAFEALHTRPPTIYDLNSSGIYYPDEKGTVNWDGGKTKVGHMNWEQFCKLK